DPGQREREYPGLGARALGERAPGPATEPSGRGTDLVRGKYRQGRGEVARPAHQVVCRLMPGRAWRNRTGQGSGHAGGPTLRSRPNRSWSQWVLHTRGHRAAVLRAHTDDGTHAAWGRDL